jgi:hypothetical protein
VLFPRAWIINGNYVSYQTRQKLLMPRTRSKNYVTIPTQITESPEKLLKGSVYHDVNPDMFL